LEPAQRELLEAYDLLDDAKDRFDWLGIVENPDSSK